MEKEEEGVRMKISRLCNVIKSVAICTLVLLLLASSGTVYMKNFLYVAKAADPTNFSISPTLIVKDPGDLPPAFIVSVSLSYVEGLYTWAFSLRWERGLLQCTNAVEEVDFFDGDFSPLSYDDHIDVGSTLTGDVPGKTGSGSIASFTLKPIGTGNCTISVENPLLIDKPGNLIAIGTITNATFYTTMPKASYTFTPDPLKETRFDGRPIVNETITFNASSSYDPDQPYKGQPGTGIAWYSWDWGDFSSDFVTDPVITHNYSVAATYLVKLIVYDDEDQVSPEFRYPDAGLRVQYHALSLINVSINNDPPIVQVGGKVYLNVTLLNQGSEPEYVNVTAFANGVPVNNTRFVWYYWSDFENRWEPRYNILSGDNATAEVSWDTTGFSDGDYTMSANITLVKKVGTTWPSYAELESNMTDNYMDDGSVNLTPLGVETHNIAVQNVGVSPSDLEVDEWAYTNAQIKNKSNVDEHFNATVTVLYPNSTICKTWTYVNTTLGVGTTKNLGAPIPLALFKGSKTLPEGSYTVTVMAVIVNSTTLEEITDESPSDNVVTELTLIRMLPWASFEHSPETPLVGEAVTFDAAQSYAPGLPGGTIEKYLWTFADGYTFESVSPTVTHKFDRPGSYAVTLKVTDDAGLTNEISASPPVSVVSFHDVAVSSVKLSKTVATVGDVLFINVTVTNLGSFAETVNVTVFSDSDEIATQTNKALAVGGELKLTFSWSTANVPKGDYEITAEISEVLGETEVGDNILDAGAATIEGAESSLSIEVSTVSLKLGESATISGTISPARGGTSVTVWGKPVDGDWESISSTSTSSAGTYSFEWTPDAAGSYVVYSSWAGDDFTLSSKSDLVAVIVSVEQPPAVDIFMISTAALGIILVATIVYFLRKPK